MSRRDLKKQADIMNGGLMNLLLTITPPESTAQGYLVVVGLTSVLVSLL